MEARPRSGEPNPGEHADQPITGRDWWALLLIVLGYGFYNLDKSLLSVLIEPIKAEFLLSDTQMGLLSGLVGSLPFAFACIPVGMLADRMNRRNLIAALIAGWSMVTGLTALARTVPILFVTRVGIGVFEAGFTPASLSSLSDRFPLRLRSTIMGVFNLGAPIGLFMGMAMGGFVEDNHGWRIAFLIAGIPGLIIAALLLTTNEPRRGAQDRPQAATDGNTDGRATGLGAVFMYMLRDRAMRNIAMGMTWGAAMLSVFAVWTPSLLRRTYDMSATDAGLQSGLIVGIGGALGSAVGGMIADRVGRGSMARKMLPPMAGVSISAAIGLTALLGGGSAAMTGLMLGFAAFFCQFYIGTCYGVSATLAGPNRRSVTLSVLLVLFNLISYSLGAGLVGKVSDMLAAGHGTESLRLAYAMAFAFCLLALFHFWRAHADLRQREAI